MPAHHAAQPSPLLRDRLMPALPQLVFGLFAQLRPLRFETVMRRTQKRPSRIFAQICVKPRKSNVSGFPAPRLLPVRGGEPPELDQPRLAGVQLQPELREPLAQSRAGTGTGSSW